MRCNVRVAMDISCNGDRFAGSITRERDQLCVTFVGTLELIAALERLGVDEDGADSDAVRTGSEQ